MKLVHFIFWNRTLETNETFGTFPTFQLELGSLSNPCTILFICNLIHLCFLKTFIFLQCWLFKNAINTKFYYKLLLGRPFLRNVCTSILSQSGLSRLFCVCSYISMFAVLYNVSTISNWIDQSWFQITRYRDQDQRVITQFLCRSKSRFINWVYLDFEIYRSR